MTSTGPALSKRELLKYGCGGAVALAGTASLAAPDAGHTPAPADMTPDQALALLKKGNADFVADHLPTLPVDRKRRLAIAKTQHPFAVLVGCSDSRVPPELLFGRGLGELFIIRVAGNTVDSTALGSIEYAVAHLGVPLIVVLGHERCGAVAAAVDAVEKKAGYSDAIEAMIAPILPAVLNSRGRPGDLVDLSVKENVRRTVAFLKRDAAIAERVDAGTLKIVGAQYDLDDGSVDFSVA